MNNIGRKLLLLILIFLLLAWFIILIMGLLTFPAGSVMKVYLWPWAMSNAIAGMVDVFIPVTVTAVLLGFSFFFTSSGSSGRSLNFSRLVSSSVFLFLFLTAVFTVLTEGIAPGIRSRLEEFRGNTSFAQSSLREADRLVRQKQYEEAILFYNYYLSIDPDAEDVIEKQEETAAILELNQTEADSQTDGTDASRGRLLNMSAAELIDAAKGFMQRRDYYSAHYYATIANQIDPQRDEARRLASQAWNRISEANFSAATDEAKELYQRKRDAYTQLTRDNIIEAYYLFRNLADEYPLEADIQTFSKIALERVKQESFFIDELEHARQIPGRHQILFLNRQEGNLKELIYFERFIPLGSIAYCYGVEIMGITAEGGVRYHLTAPAGKVIEASAEEGDQGSPGVYLMLRSIDRSKEGILYEPRFLEGRDELDHPALRPLRTPVGTIPGFSLSEVSLKLHRIPDLLALRPGYTARGYHPGAIETELVMRLMRPFGLLIFSYLAIALGWMLRVIGRRRWYHYLLLPVVPLVVFLLSDLYLYSSRLLYLYFVLQAGLTLTLVFMVMIQAILLTFVLLMLAGQSTHETS